MECLGGTKIGTDPPRCESFENPGRAVRKSTRQPRQYELKGRQDRDKKPPKHRRGHDGRRLFSGANDIETGKRLPEGTPGNIGTI